ncbi:MAG: 50S ribosomal protein L34e, partial [Candidatus Hodarchaeota archaeon]
MPAPLRRTKSQKTQKLRTPGAKLAIHYSKRGKSAANCEICKKALQGTPKARKSGIRGLSKSAKRPNRPYGGRLCANCLKT